MSLWSGWRSSSVPGVGHPAGPTPAHTANAVTPFMFPVTGQPVRVVTHDGDPWFVASDVAKVLGYREPGLAIRTHCKGGAKHTILTSGGPQTLTIIPERDVYRLIMRSKLPAGDAVREHCRAQADVVIYHNGSGPA